MKDLKSFGRKDSSWRECNLVKNTFKEYFAEGEALFVKGPRNLSDRVQARSVPKDHVHQVRGRERRLKSRTTKTIKIERDLTKETHLPSSNLDGADHFEPFHSSNWRRTSKRMITLDLNHLGNQREVFFFLFGAMRA